MHFNDGDDASTDTGDGEHRVGEREQVLDDDTRAVGIDALRPVRSRKTTLVGHHQPEAVREQRRHPAPASKESSLRATNVRR